MMAEFSPYQNIKKNKKKHKSKTFFIHPKRSPT
jgi:hypothetical protein